MGQVQQTHRRKAARSGASERVHSEIASQIKPRQGTHRPFIKRQSFSASVHIHPVSITWIRAHQPLALIQFSGLSSEGTGKQHHDTKTLLNLLIVSHSRLTGAWLTPEQLVLHTPNQIPQRAEPYGCPRDEL